MTNGSEPDEPATDVLAAEEFGVPAPDPALRPENLDLPADLVGDEPRDVLVAEEFAMPAPDEAHLPPSGGGRGFRAKRLVIMNLSALVVAAWLSRRALRRRAARRDSED